MSAAHVLPGEEPAPTGASTETAAAILGVTPRQVRRWCRDGDLRAFRGPRREWLVAWDAISPAAQSLAEVEAALDALGVTLAEMTERRDALRAALDADIADKTS